MTQLDKIKEALARHTHSTAVMRLANPPFVEGVSKEDVEWLIAENEDKHVEQLKKDIADLVAIANTAHEQLDAANHANESNLNTIQQFSDKIAVLKMNHAHEIENHKAVIANQYTELAARQVIIDALKTLSWWQHTKDSFMAWFHAHVV